MARTGFIHHFGTFLLFAATILLIVTDISAPVVNNISLLRVQLDDSTVGNNDRHPAITFGTFGWCTQDVSANGEDFCSRSAVGYDPVPVISDNIQGISFSGYAQRTSAALTKVMILHPIATGIAFISFFLSLGASFVGSLLASLGALLTFVVTAVVLITDFVWVSIVMHEVNDSDVGNATGNARAEYGAAAWTTLVAGILALIASVILFFTCCSARLHRRREVRTKY